jgi:cellulose 1,4-beta-cellobiosidase
MRIPAVPRGPLYLGVAALGFGLTAPAQTTCAQFATIPVANGEYNIQTNEWNSSAQQCLTISGSSFTVSTANFSLPTNGPPATYPSIYKGRHWGNCTTGSNLPLQVGNIGAATSSWNTTPAPGNWNTAYDIWVNQTATTSGQPNGAEIMIWINHQGPSQPAGSKVATATIGGATWDVWIGNAGWNIVSYVRNPAGHIG